MKLIRLMPLVLLLTLGLFWTTEAGSPSAEPGIQFTKAQWAAVLKKAKAEKKLIFLDAYADWCGPCKMLQKNVFTKQEVAEYFNKRFINVKLNVEEGDGVQVAQRYAVEALPTLLFIDGDGRVVKKVIGLQSPADLLAAAKSVK